MIENVVQAVFINRWPWWAGGIAIGLLVPFLYYFLDAALGVSTGYGNLVKIIFRPQGLSWFNSDTFADPWGRRLLFILGMIGGGFISGLLSGSFSFSTEMGQFTGAVDWPPVLSMIYFLTGGIFLGLGARIAGGCTSGHSIHGISSMHKSSMYVTISFLMAAALSANLLRILLLGGR